MVGHTLFNDFKVLKFKHPKNLIRDTGTAPYAKIRAGLSPNGSVALRHLAYVLLGLKIQGGEHNSIEDAQVTMAIYRLVEKEWEEDLQKRSSEKRSRRKKATEGVQRSNKADVNPLDNLQSISKAEISDYALLTNDSYWHEPN